MSADFTPDKENISSIGAFRFWCQKVLPLVYDDSLSYYELLCKVVSILNVVIENANKLNEGYTSLYDAFEALQGYVNGYFTNLDLSGEVDRKIDQMAAEGFFDALVQRIAIPISQKGAVNGVATLNSDGKLVQMPSAADTGALALNGSNTMTGNVVVEKGYPAVFAKETATARGLRISAYPNNNNGVENYKDNSNYRGIRMSTENDSLSGALKLVQMLAGQWSEYTVIHTGNKPNGNYTGNGSAEKRTIDAGGIGKFVAVYSYDAGASPAIIVTPLGAFGKNSSGVKVFGYNDISFADGVLTVSSSDNDINANGKTYYYQVL